MNLYHYFINTEVPSETYKGCKIQYTGISVGGITTFVASKEGCKNIGGTLLEYVKKCIDYLEE